MPTKIKLPSGKTRYREQIRIKDKGKIIHQESKNFSKPSLARKWKENRLADIKVNGIPKPITRMTISELAEDYVKNFGEEVRLGRTKLSDIRRIAKYDIAKKQTQNIQSGDYVSHIQHRLLSCEPQTANNDLVWISTLLKFGITVHNIEANIEQLESAQHFLRSTGMIARSNRRDRLPTPEEHTKLITYFSTKNPRSTVPMLKILRFAMYSSRRQSEITRIQRSDNNPKAKTGLVRDMKHPRSKDGNHQRFRYTDQAWTITKEQSTGDIIFPYNQRTVSSYFTKACKFMEIDDLRFHDYRHLATTWLFTEGHQIHEVAQFTLHESWDTLKRYTHLTPEIEQQVKDVYKADKSIGL